MKIEFKCSDPSVIEHCPVVPMSESMPKWYKELPKYPEWASKCPMQRLLKQEFPTVKACQPVYDYMTSGYMIPWSYETMFKKVKSNDIYSFEYFSSYKEYIGCFADYQLPELKTTFFKVNQPWTIKTPKGYSCLYFQSFYDFEKRYSILPAIVDTDTQHKISFVGYMLQDEFKVMPNEPMVYVMPFKRDEFKYSIEQIMKDELGNEITGSRRVTYGSEMPAKHAFYINNSYRILGWVKKIFR